MLKHPNVIASCVLGASVVVAAIMVCVSIHSLERTIARRPLAIPPGFPSELTLSLRTQNNGPLPIMIRQPTAPDAPLQVQVLTRP